MNEIRPISALVCATAMVTLFPSLAGAHAWHADSGEERIVFDEAYRARMLAEFVESHREPPPTPMPTAARHSAQAVVAAGGDGLLLRTMAAAAVAAAQSAPAQAAPFLAFAPAVKSSWDTDFLYVESNGIPAHNMMVGITNWQQQVPLPHPYTGDNAWRIPLHPVPAKQPVSIKGRFLRGAIALAANGVPIFNPQNNRGEISQEIGELDEWSGHCGRADDYHYHAAPLHLQATVGKGLPIACALDGYPIYGLNEPDGSSPGRLDECQGHESAKIGYHYHASTKYPYVIGGFHGEVIEREGQVDPQPRAGGIRGAGAPLRGAKITDFTASRDGKAHTLQYTIGGKPASITYEEAASGAWKFQYVSADGARQEETYQAARRGSGPPPRDVAGAPPPRRAGEGKGGRREVPGERGNRGPQEAASLFGPDAMKKSQASFVLTSPEVADGENLPVDYTGDGSGATLPLAWKGAPAGTKSFALVMDHLAPDNAMKWYWTMWDIPAATTALPKNVRDVGKTGTGFKGRIGYEPPHSQGPGAKTYVITVYALSEPLQVGQSPGEVNRDVLLAAMKDKVLASASLHVVYTRGGSAANNDRRPARREGDLASGGVPPQTRQEASNDAPPRRNEPRGGGPEGKGGKGGGKGGPDNKGLIKPRMDDTVHVSVYADNWFVMFINGELVAVDSIKFTPHNVVSLDILPDYPMTIAVMAKDNADPKTGLEYGDHIGDGGLIIKFADGTVSNAKWKAKNFFKGPLDHDVKNPRVEDTPVPDGWWKTDFDDSKWASATEYTEERVNPKEPYYNADFSGAKFIWSDDLDLDNTVIFRAKVEKPGWKPRWNTKPDLDISGAPFK